MEFAASIPPFALSTVQQYGQSVDELLSKYSPAMYRAALQRLGNPTDAEDALQDALLSAARNLGQFKGECHISTWLIAIAINSARMQLRRERRHKVLSLDQTSEDRGRSSRLVMEPLDYRPNPEQDYWRTELHRIIIELTDQLSPSLRKAFRLRVLEGRSIREAALSLGVTEGTVKAQFFRARARMNILMRQSLRLPGSPKVRSGTREGLKSYRKRACLRAMPML
jgi:RNA polymerase sigma-70 factor, ECF subfamily